MKLTKRKGFNFFRSYFDVYNELSDKDKVKFMDALLDRQFLGIKPENLNGMAKFAYISQTNSIDTQVKGYEMKTGDTLKPIISYPCQGVKEKDLNPTQQEEVQVQVQEEVQEQVQEQVQEKEEVKEKVKEKKGDSLKVIYPFDSDDFKKWWGMWLDYKKSEHKFSYRSPVSELAALKKLSELASGEESNSIKIIEESIANGWKGFFKLENNETNQRTNKKGAGATDESIARIYAEKFAKYNQSK